MSSARVRSLHVYPVKGCRGIDVDRAQVAVTGLVTQGAGDREWMVVDDSGRFLTQREHPRLALVVTSAGNNGLRLSAAGMPELDVSRDAGVPSREVVVWRSAVLGADCGDAAAAWMSRWLGHGVRVVRFDRARARACNPEYAGNSGAHTLFADGYPVLVVNAASLAELNARLAARGHPALPMNRFRPNVVIEGLPAFDEDHVDTIAIGGVVLRLVKPCIRCQVTTTDQGTAQVGIEPLPTLGKFRMNEKLGGVAFGVNAIVAAGAGSAIATGDPAAIEYRF